jgi:hypothetical protein
MKALFQFRFAIERVKQEDGEIIIYQAEDENLSGHIVGG